MTTPDRLPLAVQVYDRLIARLQSAGVRPGDLVPPETQLAADLGVSRTILRESLRLLEEDGFLERAEDRRRRRLSVAGGPSGSFTSPLESLVRVPGRLTTTVIRSEVLPATSWAARHLHVSVGALVVTRESLLLTTHGPVASAIEFMPAESSDAERVRVPSRPERTMLAELGPSFTAGLQPLVWRLSPTAVRSTRTGLDRLPPETVLSALTAVLGRGSRPAHLAKYVLRLDSLVLEVVTAPHQEVGATSWASPGPMA